MREVEVLILGAGLAGLGAGVEAQRLGRDSLILEAAPTAGGLCRGITIAGCMFDRYGPKVIVERESSQELVQLLGADVSRHELHEVVHLSGLGLIGFPVQRHLVELPPADRETVLKEISIARSEPGEVRNYREWLLSSYGPYLCEKVLFPYEEKKWQMPLSDMDYRWALERPVAVDLKEVLEGAERKLPPSRTYFYPREGNLSGLVGLLAERAGPIRHSSPVTGIDPGGKTVSAGGETYRYEHLISSLPLDKAVGMTAGFDTDLAARTRSLLKWLSVRVYNLVFEGTTPLVGDAVYFPEPSVGFRRVAVLQNLCPALPAQGLTAVSVEVAMGRGERTTPEEELGEVVEQLLTIPQFSTFGPLLESDSVDIAEAYPLQRDGLREHVPLLTRMYQQWDIWHCGRAGTFNYCDMDVAYQQGRRAVRLAVT
ncbi:protoporphyrinogen/coproporphyrinogen oxidase [Streptomyces sp. NPDC055025]